MQRIVIIGAGLIGAALAYRLSQGGAQVTVLEAALQPAAEASGRSLGWINASFFVNEAHHHLRVAGMAAHHRLARDLLSGTSPSGPSQSGLWPSGTSPSDLWQWPGCLWWEAEGAGFDSHAQKLAELGYPAREVTGPEFAVMEPALADPPKRALYLPQEGAFDPAALTQALLLAAAGQGAALWFGLRATGFVQRGDAVCGVRTHSGIIAADQVIVAAGTGAAALLAAVHHPLPMLPRPGLILRTRPVAPLIRHILATPWLELRQDAAGRLIAPLAANHQSDATETAPQDPQALVAAALARLEALFPGVSLSVEQTALAWRPVPGDGLPAIGAVSPGLWLAVMHSGVTLAPIVAECLAAEVLGQGADPLLAQYLPGRFKV